MTSALVFGGVTGRRLRLMVRAQSETSSRLSVDDWIQAGFAILAEEGIKIGRAHV